MTKKINHIIQYISFLKKKLADFVRILFPNLNARLLNNIPYNLAIDKYFVMQFTVKRIFLFRCNKCDLILSIELEEQEDLEKVNENKVIIECPCGGKCKILRN